MIQKRALLRKYTGTLFVVILALVLSVSNLSAATQISLDTASKLKATVGFLFLPGQGDKEPTPWGTAFFIGVKHPEKDFSYVYLLTAKHLLKTLDQTAWQPKVLLRLNTRDGGTEFHPIEITPDGPQKNVFLHPDDLTADIAILGSSLNLKLYDLKVIPEDYLTSKKDFKDLKIREGTDIFFIGLFSGHTDTSRNYPMIRFGKVALLSEEKIQANNVKADLYLVDTGAYGGNSGSPVFFYLGSDRNPGGIIVGPPIIKLAGVISGRFDDPQRVEIDTAKTNLIAKSNMGIAFVVPAYKIKELLMGPELTDLRK